MGVEGCVCDVRESCVSIVDDRHRTLGKGVSPGIACCEETIVAKGVEEGWRRESVPRVKVCPAAAA